LRLLPPRPPGLPRTEEDFPSRTGVTFDPIAAADSAADMTLELLFNSERANRLVQYHAEEPAQPSLQEVIESTLASTKVPMGASGLELEVKHAVDDQVLEALLGLAADKGDSEETKAIARYELRQLRAKLAQNAGAGMEDRALHTMQMERIDAFFRDPAKFVPAKPVAVPPGMPIG
jgi:hypothetical protein